MQILKNALIIMALIASQQSYAGYRYNYVLSGSFPALNTQPNENTQPSEDADGRYRCDFSTSEGSSFYGQCLDGIFLGDDGGGTPITGTCSNGSYNSHYPGDESESWSGKCGIDESIDSPDRKDGNYSCTINDNNLNSIDGQCSDGEFTAMSDAYGTFTGYCKFRTYTVIDKDLNVLMGACN